MATETKLALCPPDRKPPTLTTTDLADDNNGAPQVLWLILSPINNILSIIEGATTWA
jgi:hypothetical protein